MRRSTNWPRRALGTGLLPSAKLLAAPLLAAPLLAALLFPATLLAAEPEASKTPSQLQADALFADARRLLEQGNYHDACRLFERSLELDSSPGTLLNLGNCYEQEGDLVRALTTFERALGESQLPSANPRKRQAWGQAAKQRGEALRERVPMVTFQPSPTPGVQLRVDGRALPRLDVPLRLNPGPHRVELLRNGRSEWTQDLNLILSQGLHLELPALPDAAESPAQSTGPEVIVHAPPFAQPPGREERAASSSLPWYFLGGSATLGAASLVTALSANSKHNELERRCPTHECTDPRLHAVKDDGTALATTTYVLWALGGASAATAITLFVTRGADPENPTRVAASCSGSGCGLTATGAF